MVMGPVFFRMSEKEGEPSADRAERVRIVRWMISSHKPELQWLVYCGLINVVIGLYYYLCVIKRMWIKDARTTADPVPLQLPLEPDESLQRVELRQAEFVVDSRRVAISKPIESCVLTTHDLAPSGLVFLTFFAR